MGNKAFDFVRGHWLGIINFHIFLFVSGALLAPCLMHLNQAWVAKVVYGFYGFFCHQKASRCLFILGDQMAICSRCLSFYSSVLISGMWVGWRRPGPLSLSSALFLIFPATMDVSLQILGIHQSTNLIRLLTGSLLGVGISLYLFPRAQNALERLNVRTN